jgi:hypothetical protein
MRSSRSGSKAPTPVLPSAKTTRSNSITSQEPPAKKPRLKLNLRKPSSNDGDTIAVSRPKRASAGRSRYSEEAVISDDEVEEVKVKQSPAASSGLSSPLSPPTSVKEEIVAADVKVGGRDSYGDFMSYYIADGDDGEEELPPKPKRESKKEKPEKQQRKPRAKKVPTPSLFKPAGDRPQVTSKPAQLPPSRPSSRHNPLPSNSPAPRPVAIQPQAHPTARPLPVSRPPPVQPPMPPPRPIAEPPALEEITVKYHASVPEKVKKLQALSTALTNFGGVPSPAKPPLLEESKRAGTKKSKKAGRCSFPLSTQRSIADLSSEAPVDNFLAMFDDEESDDKDVSEPEIEPEAETPHYLEHTGEPDGPLTYGIQFIMNALKSWAQQRLNLQHMAAVQQARVSSETKSTDGNVAPPPDKPSLNSKPNLSDTPEGKAITAFRDVVESGCLQVNVVMPADLAGAVRHLYVQIDQLINQGGKPPREAWQPMSYTAQIQAHEMRVEQWREQQARAQHNAGLYSMYNTMGPPNTPGGQSQHMQFPGQIHGDRRRSAPYMPVQSHNNHASRVSLPAGIAGSSSSPPVTANYRLPRSGQTMNFSFAPENLAAIQAFGPGAFPAINQNHGPNLPNRGPMSASPINRPPFAPLAPQERPSSRNGENRSGGAGNANDVVAISGNDTHAHPPRVQRQSSGFTAVNAPANAAHDTRASGSSSRPRSPGLSRSDAVVLEDD